MTRIKPQAKKRFAVGAEVRIIMPGETGVVIGLDNEPTVLGEYWHKVKTESGERREPGCNLELVPEVVSNAKFKVRNDMPSYNETLAQQILAALQEAFPNKLSSFEVKRNTPFVDIPQQEWLTALDALLQLRFIDGRVLRSGSVLDDAADLAITSRGRDSLAASGVRIGATVTQTFHLHGPHSRVNMYSTDNSSNVASVSNDKTFVQMREAAQSIPDDSVREKILTHIAELERTKGSTNFLSAYQTFVSVIADHMTVFGPFIPLLAQMLSGH